MDLAPQLQALQHLAHLLFRLHRPHPEAMLDDPVEQQTAVAGEDDKLFGHRQFHHLPVAVVVAPGGVEAEQAQPAGEFAQVHVHHEPGWRGQGRSQGRTLDGNTARLDGMHFHPVAVAKLVAEIHRHAVHQDERHFRVRRAQGFDGILDAGMIPESVVQPLFFL